MRLVDYRPEVELCPEPPVGSTVVDRDGHEWSREGMSTWLGCHTCDPEDLVVWEWFDILDDVYDREFTVVLPQPSVGPSMPELRSWRERRR